MDPNRGLARIGKVQIGRVDDGGTFFVEELLSSDSLDRMKEKIERLLLVPAADQILLSDDGRRLEGSQKLETYGLPNVRQIFVGLSSALIFTFTRRKQS
jgi:hypothetical protein